MEDNETRVLLEKFNAGRCTEAEQKLLENWYLQRDERGIEDLSEAEFLEDLDMISHGLPLHQPVRRLLWPRVAAVAAVLAVFFIIYFEWPHSAPLVALHTEVGEKKQTYLTDGTKVWVNAGSILNYPKEFTGRTREVYLKGEAYFDVQHDAIKPFIIHTGKVVTTVLGTAFDIREDRVHHSVTVTVTRGKVSVADGSNVLAILEPNQQLNFDTENHSSVKQTVDAQQAIAWQKVDLYFDDIAFADAVKQLEKRFNVRIAFKNSRLGNCRFTGASLTGEKLNKILDVLCAFNHATYQTQPDGSILIDGPGCEK